MTNCKKHIEGGQWVCNRCGTCWDRDDDAPECKTDEQLISKLLCNGAANMCIEIGKLNVSAKIASKAMRKIGELLK